MQPDSHTLHRRGATKARSLRRGFRALVLGAVWAVAGGALAGCGASSGTDSEGKGGGDSVNISGTSTLYAHTLTLEKNGQTAEQAFLCAPTQFPEYRAGGTPGDVTSGGFDPGSARKATQGWSPVPQWGLMELGGDTLLVRRACEGQGYLTPPFDREEAEAAVEVYAVAYDAQGRPGLTPRIARNGSVTRTTYADAPGVRLSARREVADEAEAGAMAAEQLRALAPFAPLFEPYSPLRGSGTVELHAMGEVLPEEGRDRRYPSDPWIIACESGLPDPTVAPAEVDALLDMRRSLDPGDVPRGTPFHRGPQAVLDNAPHLTGCRFVEDVRDYARDTSPYPSRITGATGMAVKRLKSDAREAFVQIAKISIADAQILYHGEARSYPNGKREADPFLASDLYQTHLAAIVADLASANPMVRARREKAAQSPGIPRSFGGDEE